VRRQCIAADYNVGRFFADAEALYSYEGTFQMQNLIVGKAITGFSASSSGMEANRDFIPNPKFQS